MLNVLFLGMLHIVVCCVFVAAFLVLPSELLLQDVPPASHSASPEVPIAKHAFHVTAFPKCWLSEMLANRSDGGPSQKKILHAENFFRVHGSDGGRTEWGGPGGREPPGKI